MNYIMEETRFKILKLIVVFLLCSHCLLLFATKEGIVEVVAKEYGVFIGLNGKDIEEDKGSLLPYKILVLEPEECSKEKLDVFINNKQQVFAYLNVGSLETYRTYYKRYKKFLRASYKDWPDEYWVDVSQKEWQDFITRKLAPKYKDLGFHGFFIDNIDVYYHYPTKEIYEGLIAILTELKKSELTIIINGGDVFVSKLIDEGVKLELFDGVNQECVFTRIDFKKDAYGVQGVEEHQYLDAYLQKVKRHGKMVFLLEYGSSKKLAKKIANYCKKESFLYFISKDKTLRKDML